MNKLSTHYDPRVQGEHQSFDRINLWIIGNLIELVNNFIQGLDIVVGQFNVGLIGNDIQVNTCQKSKGSIGEWLCHKQLLVFSGRACDTSAVAENFTEKRVKTELSKQKRII